MMEECWWNNWRGWAIQEIPKQIIIYTVGAFNGRYLKVLKQKYKRK